MTNNNNNNTIYPIVLTILDGWGYRNITEGNAIKLANTPTLDALINSYPHTLLNASGIHVGLPEQQVGNSEVGHTTIGGGRVLPQDLVQIIRSIEQKTFLKDKTFYNLCSHIKQYSSKIHLIGLCSNGGVHSHINHLLEIINRLKEENIDEICIHFISDGRDTKPNCAKHFVQQITKYLTTIKIGKISTISGRYYAMDRDCRWTRTEAFYRVLTQYDNNNNCYNNCTQTINNFYEQNISDEFIVPTRVSQGVIEDNDAIIFFNFRPDRMRQIVQAFAQHEFKGFTRKFFKNLFIVTFTNYDSSLNLPIFFKPLSKTNFLGEVVSNAQLKQLRIAETEKYAHVTYFLNGGIEEPFTGEDRELIPSPDVKTYDESPEMSAKQITESIKNALMKNIYSLIIVNYANPDMIGHTGNLEATITAIETTDKCITDLYEYVSKVNGTLIITADHGNAEYMLDSNNQPCKSHTTNLVPFILIEGERKKILGHGGNISLRTDGSLADVAPTILDILDINKPKEMDGQTLIKKPIYEIRPNIIVQSMSNSI